MEKIKVKVRRIEIVKFSPKMLGSSLLPVLFLSFSPKFLPFPTFFPAQQWCSPKQRQLWQYGMQECSLLGFFSFFVYLFVPTAALLPAPIFQNIPFIWARSTRQLGFLSICHMSTSGIRIQTTRMGSLLTRGRQPSANFQLLVRLGNQEGG